MRSNIPILAAGDTLATALSPAGHTHGGGKEKSAEPVDGAPHGDGKPQENKLLKDEKPHAWIENAVSCEEFKFAGFAAGSSSVVQPYCFYESSLMT